MTPSTDVAFIQALRETVRPLAGGDPHTALMQAIDDARVFMLGEPSHGTHEFYDERIRITQRLIIEKGFNAVAVEADWPDAYRVNRFFRGSSEDKDAAPPLGGL